MNRRRILIIACTFGLLTGCAASHPKPSQNGLASLKPLGAQVRGWDYLANRLRADGVSDLELQAVYGSPRMPTFDFVPFSLRPKESPDIYKGFKNPRRIREGVEFLASNDSTFYQAEARFGVDRHVIAAILLVESQFGKNLGRNLVIERLSRVASVGEPTNLKRNLERLKEEDPSVTFEQVEARARYLESTFYPEVLATFQIAKRVGISPFGILGSSAGAFGQPQFLPTSYLRYAVDGNNDGQITLYDKEDAIFSVAKYLSSKGWHDGASLDQKRAIIWTYNKSDPYIDTILGVATALTQAAANRFGVPSTRREI